MDALIKKCSGGGASVLYAGEVTGALSFNIPVNQRCVAIIDQLRSSTYYAHAVSIENGVMSTLYGRSSAYVELQFANGVLTVSTLYSGNKYLTVILEG